MLPNINEGWEVVIVDGPARGYSYGALVEPDETLYLIPHPTRSREWLRVPCSPSAPWPGQLTYESDGQARGVNHHGEMVISYALTNETPKPKVTIVEEGADFVLLAREGVVERYVVSWGAPDGEPSVGTVSPCALCGWAGTCEEGCHS